MSSVDVLVQHFITAFPIIIHSIIAQMSPNERERQQERLSDSVPAPADQRTHFTFRTANTPVRHREGEIKKIYEFRIQCGDVTCAEECDWLRLMALQLMCLTHTHT